MTMKKLRNSIVIAVLLMVCTYTAQAQKGQVKVDLNYNYSLPLGSFKNDIISKGSATGGMGSLQYFITNKFAVGLGSGYQYFEQKYPRALYSLSKTQTVSAVLSNSIEATPLIAKATFSPLAAKALVQPYITAGAGASFIDYNQYLGEFASTQKSSAAFTAQAGAGVMIPFGRLSASGFQIGADYSYIPYKKFGYNNLNTVNFHAGVFFPLR